MAAEDAQRDGEGELRDDDRLDQGDRSKGEGQSLEAEAGEHASTAREPLFAPQKLRQQADR